MTTYKEPLRVVTDDFEGTIDTSADNPKWRSVKGFTRDDGLSVTVYSESSFTFANPERIAKDYDLGLIPLGFWLLRTGDELVDKYDRTYVSLTKPDAA